MPNIIGLTESTDRGLFDIYTGLPTSYDPALFASESVKPLFKQGNYIGFIFDGGLIKPDIYRYAYDTFDLITGEFDTDVDYKEIMDDQFPVHMNHKYVGFVVDNIFIPSDITTIKRDMHTEIWHWNKYVAYSIDRFLYIGQYDA